MVKVTGLMEQEIGFYKTFNNLIAPNLQTT